MTQRMKLRQLKLPFLLALTVVSFSTGCSKDFWYGMGYDVLRQHDCRQQAAVPENEGCARSYRDEYERYKRERERSLEESSRDNRDHCESAFKPACRTETRSTAPSSSWANSFSAGT